MRDEEAEEHYGGGHAGVGGAAAHAEGGDHAAEGGVVALHVILQDTRQQVTPGNRRQGWVGGWVGGWQRQADGEKRKSVRGM